MMTDQENPLLKAILRSNIAEAKELLKNGETLPEELNKYDQDSIVSNALRGQAFEFIDMFIERGLIGTDIYEYDTFNNSVFKRMASNLQPDEESISYFRDFLQRLQNINDEVEDQTLLGFFLNEGADMAFIKCLVDAGCDLQYKNNAEQNFIFQVVRHYSFYPQKGLAYLEYLINEGVDINAADIEGKTPLHMAVSQRRYDYIPLLMKNGADANEPDKKGYTPFYIAIIEQRSLEMYDLLKQYMSPDFEVPALHDTRIFPEFMRSINDNEDELSMLEKMIADGADLYQTSLYYNEPKSALDWALEKSDKVLNVIFNHAGIDISNKDDQGNTMLHKVCGYNVNFDKEKAKEVYRKVKMLIEKGADVNMINDMEQSPLMMASNDNLKIKTVELLMQNGAKSN